MDTLLSQITTDQFLIVYSALFLLIVSENIIPFVPGDAVLIFSAYLAGRGILHPIPTYTLTILGALTGFYLAHTFGRYGGQKILSGKKYILLPEKRIHRFERFFRKYGQGTLIIGRLIPGMRLVTALLTGLVKIALLKALLFSLIGIFLWNSIAFYAVRLIGENWNYLKTFSIQYSRIVNLILVIGILIFIIRNRRQLKKEVRIAN